MPQKRNPMTCEYVVASSRLVRAQVGVLLDSPAHAFVRDMGYWAAEWIALPEALVLAAGVVDKLAAVLEGLEVDAARMRANLDASRGQIMAEAVMMSLGRSLGHERAHELVLQASRRAASEGRDLRDVLAEEAEVTARLSGPELDQLFDPTSYLGLADASVAAVTRSTEGTP
jgi:3-carboxy-cis,cis-muconate cycloisomerase